MEEQISRDEQYRREIVSHLLQQIDNVELNLDRIQYVWALKLIAEDIAILDKLDRDFGRLPLPIRPSLMLCAKEAALVQEALKAYLECKQTTEGIRLLVKVEDFFEGAYQ